MSSFDLTVSAKKRDLHGIVPKEMYADAGGDLPHFDCGNTWAAAGKAGEN
jgi:hypothetical protein